MFQCKKGILFYFAAFLLLLSCSRKPEGNLLTIAFNGTLKTDKGIAPINNSGNRIYTSFRDRKALSLKGNENVRYDLSNFDLNQGSLRFWIKFENPTDQNKSTIVSLNKKDKNALELKADNCFLQVYFGGRALQAKRKIQPQGIWSNVAVVWNTQDDQVSLYLNGAHLDVEKLPIQNPQISDGLNIGGTNNPNNFSILIRDLQLQTNVLSDQQIASSFESDLQKMQSPIKWSAEKLEHYLGKRVTAQGTANGKAWTVDTMLASREPIQLNDGGDYRIQFRIKPMSHLLESLVRCEVWKFLDGKKIPIVSWTNSSTDLVEPGKYKTFAMDFRVEKGTQVGYTLYSLIPSKFSVFLDTIVMESKNSGWKDVQRAENLTHSQGVWVKDNEASQGKAWSNANTLLYGPYTSIGQPGKYRVSWRMKLADWVPANEPILVLDVYAHDGYLHEGRRGTRSYGKLPVGAWEFKRPYAWERKSIDFRYDGANMIEFRAHARYMKPDAVLLDTVEVQYLGRT